MQRGMLALALTIAAGLAGCSSKSTSTPAVQATQPTATAQAAQPAPKPQPIAVPASASPDQVVTVFLNALRSGDSATTESLLTAKAKEELSKQEILVDVQSAPNATYQVQAAEVLPDNPNGAHVRSQWTEKYDDGTVEYEIVWVLRKQNEGWRMAGMAMQLVPGQDLQFLNFEDPADMLKKKEEAMAALQAPAAQTAQQPKAPAQAAPAALER